MSPYQYAANNPILFIDVNGDSLSVINNNGDVLFILDDSSDKMTSITAKALYDQGTQWFEPEADNYMPLIACGVGLNESSSLKHFTWEEVASFAEEDRWALL